MKTVISFNFNLLATVDWTELLFCLVVKQNRHIDQTRDRDWEEKSIGIWDWKNVEDYREKKMNWRDSYWDLYCELTDTILNNIIFN